MKRKQTPFKNRFKNILSGTNFSLKLQIFFKNPNLNNTFSTLHSQAAHGFDIKMVKFVVKNFRGKTFFAMLQNIISLPVSMLRCVIL